jgi:arginine utilization protein RocB
LQEKIFSNQEAEQESASNESVGSRISGFYRSGIMKLVSRLSIVSILTVFIYITEVHSKLICTILNCKVENRNSLRNNLTSRRWYASVKVVLELSFRPEFGGVSDLSFLQVTVHTEVQIFPQNSLT